MRHSWFVGAAALALGVGLGMGGAAAQGVDTPIKVRVGGYFYGYYAGGSQNDAAASGIYTTNQPGYGLRQTGIFRKSRILFHGESGFDNGIRAGFDVQLRGESSNTDQIDQSWLFMDFPFGQMQLGKIRGASYQMTYNNPNVQEGVADPWNINNGDFNGFRAPSRNGLTSNGGTAFLNTFTATDKSERIVYYTPRFSGFQFGVSYAPDGCNVGAPGFNHQVGFPAINTVAPADCGSSIGNGFAYSNNVGQQSKIIDAGVNYVNKIRDVGVAVSLGVAGSSVEANAPATGGAQVFKGERQWSFGFNLDYMGFLLGAAVQQDNLGAAAANSTWGFATNLPGNNAYAIGANATSWTVGLVYRWERFRVGFNYIASRAQTLNMVGSSIGNDTAYGLEFGGAYTLGPGVTLAAGIENQKWTSGIINASNPAYNSAVNTGWVVQAGTILRF